jgi:hypothetical protein
MMQLAACGTFLGVALLVGAARADYAAELIAQSRAARLHESDEWSALLHRIKPWLRPAQSEADGPGFFLGKDGKIDAAAELEATLRAFFQPPVVEVIPEVKPGDTENHGVQHPQCRFPARYAFLDRSLRFDPARLPQQPCPRFQDWRARVDPVSVSVVFAAAYVNHPASAFGHTFLRLDRRSAPDQPLLGYAVNFAADPTTSNGVLYALGGLTGQFRGYFSILPYYLKVKEYSDLESRDLWDYKLNLTQEQVDQMLRHIWELGTTWFDYWFADENCSYHILSLIEVAVSGVKLRERFPLWTVPIDTLRTLRDVPGLLGERKRRPSLDARMKARRSVLSGPEVRVAVSLAEDAEKARPALLTLPPRRQAATLDTALDLLQYHLGDVAGDEQKAAAAERKLVFMRARVREPSADPGLPPVTPPDVGHRSMLVVVGGGVQRNRPFGSFIWRAVLHDLISASEGQMSDHQLEMSRLELRVPTDTGQLSVREFRLLRLESLDPLDTWTPKIAWRVTTGFTRERLDAADLSYWELRGGPGLSLTPLGQLVYLMEEVEFDAGTGFVHKLRARLRPTLGLLLRPADLFHLRAEMAGRWDPTDSSRMRPLFSGEAAVNLGPRFQFRGQGMWSPDDWGWQAGLGLYF